LDPTKNSLKHPMTPPTESSSDAACTAPLRTEPQFVERVWGVPRESTEVCRFYPIEHSLQALVRSERSKRIGEVWLTGDSNRIAGGPLAGKTLKEATRACAERLLGAPGSRHPSGEHVFPLLVKFLFTADKLSVQVHPPDSAATELGSWGKTEMWHILDAEPGASIAFGFQEDIPREFFEKPNCLRQAATSGDIAAMLRWRSVRAGETYFIPAGTVHAIGAGLTVCEIQQNSDITYRLYDYNRPGTDGRPRALHVEESLRVLRATTPAGLTAPVNWPGEKGRTLLAACPYFVTERWSIETLRECNASGHVEVWIVIEGAAQIEAGDARERIKAGEAVIVPASVESLRIRPAPRCTLLRSYPPDWVRDVEIPLAAAGFTRERLGRVCFPATEEHAS
jgi:mannose-6-phosphate isomerase